MQQAIEIRRDFGTFTNYKKENFVTFYRKKAQEYNSSTEAIRRIIYNTTFYDASYTAMAEKIRNGKIKMAAANVVSNFGSASSCPDMP